MPQSLELKPKPQLWQNFQQLTKRNLPDCKIKQTDRSNMIKKLKPSLYLGRSQNVNQLNNKLEAWFSKRVGKINLFGNRKPERLNSKALNRVRIVASRSTRIWWTSENTSRTVVDKERQRSVESKLLIQNSKVDQHTLIAVWMALRTRWLIAPNDLRSHLSSAALHRAVTMERTIGLSLCLVGRTRNNDSNFESKLLKKVFIQSVVERHSAHGKRISATEGQSLTASD